MAKVSNRVGVVSEPGARDTWMCALRRDRTCKWSVNATAAVASAYTCTDSTVFASASDYPLNLNVLVNPLLHV